MSPADLYQSALRVTESEEVSAYLRGRSLDPDTVELLDLARCTPVDTGWPYTKGYRLMLAMYGCDGSVRSVRFGAVLPDLDPKRISLKGHPLADSCMACGLGIQMLTTGRLPEWWPGTEPLRITVVEGEPDFLTHACLHSDAHATAPATLGIVNGSWSRSMADRIPDGAEIYIRTHHDEAGHRYAAAVKESFSGRQVKLFRSRH